jgi:hypothetical protein
MLRNILLVTVCGLALSSAAVAQDMPRLEKQGTAAQLFVDDKPFLILGGELGNSTASDPARLATHWPTLTRAGLNTVLAPVEWDRAAARPIRLFGHRCRYRTGACQPHEAGIAVVRCVEEFDVDLCAGLDQARLQDLWPRP